MTGVDLRGRLTLSVPEAGRLLYGLGRDSAYRAAEAGQIPCRRVGRRLVVPTHAALADLGMSEALIAQALGLGDSTSDNAKGPAATAGPSHASPATDQEGLEVSHGAPAP